MPSKRKGLSQRTRFEIFKRDGFRCLYCGISPTQKVLRIDHVIPVAEGGTDAVENLVTACFDCNAGKAAEPLDKKRYVATIATDADKDHAAQIREYLALQRQIAEAKNEARDELATYWEENIGPMSQKMYDRLAKLIQEWPHERLIEAMNITSDKFGDPGAEYSWPKASTQGRYFQAILRNWREGIEF